MEIQLEPFYDSPDDSMELYLELKRLFADEIYAPVLRALSPVEVLHNSKGVLIDAITKGRITFYRGRFTGRFNSKLSQEIKKLGGKFRGGGWNLPLRSLPPEVRRAHEVSFSSMERTVGKVDAQLRNLLPEKIADKVRTKKIFDTALWRFDKKFKRSVRAITVPAQLTKEARARISEQYTENMKLYIRDWTENEIVKLRKEITIHAFKGDRYEGIVEAIQRRYEVGKSKAQFLARQETNLLLSKFKESRYTDAGMPYYIWKNVAGSKKHPVRPMHRALAGTKQRWDNPPITSPNGQRNNPGEDFGCRCFPIPVTQI